MNNFQGFDFTNFWHASDYAEKAYESGSFDEETIKKLEKKLHYKLPESYIELMKLHNGGIPNNRRFPTKEATSWANDHIAIEGIYGIGSDKSYSLGGELGSRFWIDGDWEYPDIGIPICDCPSAGHDMIFLDYRECGPKGEPCVVHVDQESDYKITWLAKNFEEFIRGLTFDEE